MTSMEPEKADWRRESEKIAAPKVIMCQKPVRTLCLAIKQLGRVYPNNLAGFARFQKAKTRRRPLYTSAIDWSTFWAVSRH